MSNTNPDQQETHMTITTIDEYTTIIDYISSPDRYAVIKYYGEINELTVFASDDFNKVITFICLTTGKAISAEMTA